jgi:hypothetical protein
LPAHADHVGDLGERTLRQRPTSQLASERRLLVVREDVEADVHTSHPVELAHRFGYTGLEMATDWAACGGQRNHHVDDAVLVDVYRPDHLELDDVTPKLGVDDGAQRVDDLVLGGHMSIQADATSEPARLKTDRDATCVPPGA